MGLAHSSRNCMQWCCAGVCTTKSDITLIDQQIHRVEQQLDKYDVKLREFDAIYCNIEDLQKKYNDMNIKYAVLETKHELMMKRVDGLKGDVKDCSRQVKVVEAKISDALLGHSEILEDNIIIIQD
jgi:hypothetical protein